MRFFIGCLAVVAVMILGNATAPVAMAAGHDGAAFSAAQQAPATGKLDVKIDVGHQNSGGGVWWQSPVWMAIGGIGLVLLIVMVVLMARGGGTTVVKG